MTPNILKIKTVPNRLLFLKYGCLVYGSQYIIQGIGITLHGLNYLGKLIAAEIASDLEAVSGEEVKPKKRATKKTATKEEGETKKTTKKSK